VVDKVCLRDPYLLLEMLGKSLVAIVYRAVDLPRKAIDGICEVFPAVREARRWQEDISQVRVKQCFEICHLCLASLQSDSSTAAHSLNLFYHRMLYFCSVGCNEATRSSVSAQTLVALGYARQRMQNSTRC
jgi:hypothetical protein